MALLFSCGSNTVSNYPLKNIFESNTPILSFGADDEVEKPGAYESIWNYFVDNNGNVYIADDTNFKIDKFDPKGNYLFSFGGRSHQSIRFPGWIHIFAVNSRENLIAFSHVKRKLLLFTSDSKNLRNKDLNSDLKNLRIKRLKFDRKDCLFLLTHSDASGYQLFKYDPETEKYVLIHSDNNRIRPTFKDVLPDYDFDEMGNIYITDTIEYRVFKYSNNGRLLYTFLKNHKKHKIREQDLNFLMRRNRIRKIPNYKNALENLKGPSGFFPAIFGINIDGKHIYVWNSHQESDKKYLLDVYDFEFKRLCTTSFYNDMGNNRVFINNKRFYIPNIGSDNSELKGSVGRFGVFNIPHNIQVYQISMFENR